MQTTLKILEKIAKGHLLLILAVVRKVERSSITSKTPFIKLQKVLLSITSIGIIRSVTMHGK